MLLFGAGLAIERSPWFQLLIQEPFHVSKVSLESEATVLIEKIVYSVGIKEQ